MIFQWRLVKRGAGERPESAPETAAPFRQASHEMRRAVPRHAVQHSATLRNVSSAKGKPLCLERPPALQLPARPTARLRRAWRCPSLPAAPPPNTERVEETAAWHHLR